MGPRARDASGGLIVDGIGVLDIWDSIIAVATVGLSVYSWRSSFAVEGYISVGINKHHGTVTHGNNA